MTTTTNELLYAQPASVHFGGFELDRSVQQRVRVHNNSAKAVRLRYTFPTGKKGFRTTFASSDRPSFVSPGLCEEIIVSFTPPADFQYYYDCIQVQCEEVAYGSSAHVARSGATLIPLHAYPMVNEVAFPTRMDFGVVPRNTCARKCVNLKCSVPVEFEYELRVTKSHPAFTVFPLTGTIPPRGDARIELEFRPVVYATASAELELHVSQLNFVPRVCTLAGSSSNTAGDVLAVEVTQQKSNSLVSLSFEEKPRNRFEAQEKISKSNTPRKDTKSRSKKYAQGEPQFGDTEDEEMEVEKVEGIEIPRNLDSVTSVSFVLNQQQGKLKPKDLKKAIEANRALHQQQREEQAKLSTGNVVGDEDEDVSTLGFQSLVQEEEGFLERVCVSKQVKDMFFQQELREVTESEKALEFQSHTVHLGQRLLSQEQIAHITKLRELNMKALTYQQRKQLRTLFINVHYESPLVSDYHQEHNGVNQRLLFGELKTSVLPAHFVPAYTPDYKPYKNDLWERRQRVLRRLIRAVSTCILRLRAQRRLDRIHLWIGGTKTRAQVREKVALDWQSSIQVGDGDGIYVNESVNPDASIHEVYSAEEENSELLTSNDVECQYFLSSFPLVEESTTQKRRAAIEMSADWELKFNSFTFMELKPRDEALLIGHEHLALPAFPTHVPLEQGRALRQGADDECGVVSSLLLHRAHCSTQSRAVNAPSLIEMMPLDIFLCPQASVRPLLDIQGPRETEPSYALRPRRVFRTPPTHFSAWQDSQLGLQSVMGAHDGASLFLSDVFSCSAYRKPVEPIFSSAPAFAASENDRSLFKDVWSVSTATMPSLARNAEDVLSLSDSESDDDVENREGSTCGTHQVSWNRACELFENLSTDQQEDQSRDIYEYGELLGREKGVCSFERYRHLIRQERTYNTFRQELLERLPKVGKRTSGSFVSESNYSVVASS
ncbi:Primary ciliary dyskinesia protein [Phytophthora megakarya]|uniref:Primary ciliary dyskinesia protein n=1 Tax=Phytophthora megakarya TaxID=4795 RepID=A0A225WLQ5_9STRA|nr:Primary ciliary dyskinesia protein [Phytophthora megakarya]